VPEESKKPVKYDVDGYDAVTDALVSLFSINGYGLLFKPLPKSVKEFFDTGLNLWRVD